MKNFTEKSKNDPSYKDYKEDNLLECKQLWAWYDQSNEPVLKDISLKISKPMFVLICGPNGSGKTSLLRVLRGLDNEFAMKVKGTISLEGINLLKTTSENLGEKIGIVFQRPLTQLFGSKVSDEVRLGPMLSGYKWEDIIRRENEFLEKLKITHLRNKRTLDLSGGEQQKTVIAGTLALYPKVLLLDEPTSYFDPVSRKDLLETLRELTKTGVLILMTSHRLEEEIKYADYLLVFDKGSLKLQGKPEDVMFTKEMESILPPRGFLSFSSKLWQNNLGEKKILDPTALSKLVIKRIKRPKPKLPPPIVKSSIVEFKNLDVVYANGVRALQDINIKIPQRSITTILGPNGSGKTSIAKVCLKLVKSSKGAILIDGVNIDRIKKQKLVKTVGYAPQDPRDILFCETTLEEVMFSARNLNLSDPKKRAQRIINILKLDSLKDKPPETLSLGQQRLLTIASALVSEPKILFLDEPELALDGSSLRMVIDLLLKLKNICALVILTHDVDNFAPLSDYLIILNKGRVVTQANPFKALTQEVIQNAKLKLPELFELWQSFPRIKTWNNLADKALEAIKNNENHSISIRKYSSRS